MLDVYNLYLGGFLPKVSPKTNVHNRKELKNKFRNIISLNNSIPLVMVKLSDSTQAYALNVKERSMELGEAAQGALTDVPEHTATHMQNVAEIFNDLLNRSDAYGKETGQLSRPGGELRNLVDNHAKELEEAGISVDEGGFLSVPNYKKGEAVQVPEKFMRELQKKCDEMSMNPMEYVQKRIYSYAHLHQSDIGCAYQTSIYTGMLFNSYC